jgi:response regulator of citrate/malate metabolism
VISTLVVDDDYRVATVHAEYVARVAGYRIAGQAHTAAEAYAATERQPPDLILLDLYLPDEHGLTLVRRLRERPGPYPDIIVITAARDVASVRTAMQLGVVHYLVKPFGFDRLAEKLVAYRDLRRRLTAMKVADQDDVDSLYGLLRSRAPIKKGHSAPTMSAVRLAVGMASPDISAAEVAAAVGISRPTAQRYLSHLAQEGIIEVRLRYGTAGRPEHRYRRRS